MFFIALNGSHTLDYLRWQAGRGDFHVVVDERYGEVWVPVRKIGRGIYTVTAAAADLLILLRAGGD